jgi:phage FluMu protein Com
MNEHRCWRCGRSLNVEKAPKDEAILRCPRCKAANAVRDGQQAKSPIGPPQPPQRAQPDYVRLGI